MQCPVMFVLEISVRRRSDKGRLSQNVRPIGEEIWHWRFTLSGILFTWRSLIAEMLHFASPLSTTSIDFTPFNLVSAKVRRARLHVN
jgi:hypothetical protein